MLASGRATAQPTIGILRFDPRNQKAEVFPKVRKTYAVDSTGMSWAVYPEGGNIVDMLSYVSFVEDQLVRVGETG